jgi:hypothetical protein
MWYAFASKPLLTVEGMFLKSLDENPLMARESYSLSPQTRVGRSHAKQRQ